MATPTALTTAPTATSSKAVSISAGGEIVMDEFLKELDGMLDDFDACKVNEPKTHSYSDFLYETHKYHRFLKSYIEERNEAKRKIEEKS